MSDFLSGALVVLSFAIAVYQLRYWRRSRDRLFLAFALGFALMGANRGTLVLLSDDSETRTYVYVVRLSAFLIILWGIWDKNRASRASSSSSPEAPPQP